MVWAFFSVNAANSNVGCGVDSVDSGDVRGVCLAGQCFHILPFGFHNEHRKVTHYLKDREHQDH